MRPHYVNLDSLFYLFISEYLWKIGCWSWRRHNRRWIHTGVSFSPLFFWKSKLELGTLSQLLKADSELSVSQGCLMDEDLVRLLGDWTASWHQVLGKLVHVSVYIVRLHTGSVLCITDWLRHQTCGLQRTAVTLMSHMIMMWYCIQKQIFSHHISTLWVNHCKNIDSSQLINARLRWRRHM